MTANSAITVFGQYFLMSTMTAEQEAHRVVYVFRSAFVQVENLEPSVFLDRAGNDVTGGMYRLPRPANAYHIGVDALIYMSDLSPAFTDRLSTYALSHFLPLPPAFQVSTLFITISTEPVASPIAPFTAADTLDTDILSPSAHVGSRHPIKVLTQVSLMQTPPTRCASVRANMYEEIVQASGHVESSDNEEDV